MKPKVDVNAEHRIIVGRKITNIRNVTGLTRNEIADICGYSSDKMVGHIETGRRGMKHDKIKLLAEYVGIDYHFIIDDNDYSIEQLKLLKECSSIIKQKDSHPFYPVLKKLLLK